ncbi:hypothetical protein OG874_37645 [Nocardia sp. NBC_00565]|uniref:hypothetical protein n=1 Tax=Nocardia sp. NBC_00565 TaxID=2975993 RepID=UPI002E81C9EC|nr:hypothetical protein [Nocardia sp. NBC_00565]WUC02391.1 hypothetical protein OG874_37645 [Nocardia sp. NBC_00565]
MSLAQWLMLAVAVIAAAIASISAAIAVGQAKSAKRSADAAHRMADIDARRRHEELAPLWKKPRLVAATGASSFRLKLQLERGELDHLVIEIYDSPGITFDVSRQADVVAERAERNEAMEAGSSVAFWVKIRPGHERRLCLRVRAGLKGAQWKPALLPEIEVVVDGSDDA